jgi:2-C-methyl-D-erythritol 4-phosphate cytidylyltransferase
MVEAAPAASGEPEGMNVLIPIGGSGLRFAQAGLTMPKPMLKLAGRPLLAWVVESLKLTAADTIFVGLSHECVPSTRAPTHPPPPPLPAQPQGPWLPRVRV